MVRPDWITEPAWRALRTSFQVFAGVFVVTLITAMNAYAEPPHLFDWSMLYYNGIVLGVSTVMAFWMNK